MDLRTLVTRSQEFSDYLTTHLDGIGESAPEARPRACRDAAVLSFEHAHGIRVLFEAGAPNSGSVLLRAQYESLLRSAWALYAASEAQLAKLTVPLTQESSAAAKNARSADEMLKDLERIQVEAPTLRGLVVPLREIRDASWAAMNSFAHGGLHPLQRTNEGFPVQLAMNVLKNSNGMLHMAARLLARLTPSPELVERIDHSFQGFTDCLQ